MHIKILKKIFFIFYLIRKTNWIKLLKLHSQSSDNVLLFWPNGFIKPNSYFLSSAFENDFALINALIALGKPFRIVFFGKNALKLRNSTIYYNVSNLYSFMKGSNYIDSLHLFQIELLKKGNTIIPEYNNTLFWENKIFMHKKFEEFNISTPKTFCISSFNDLPRADDLKFPLLLKPAHSSGSTGILKINDIIEYKSNVRNYPYKEFIIQEWVDMRRDLRLIFIGDELVLHYWRKNESHEWKPTSTGHGSTVDFLSLPDQWMGFIFNEFKKLNLVTGALDITWKNDDLSSQPLILEVSPSYMPNPSPTGKYSSKPYSDFKKSFCGKNAYYKRYINIVFDLKLKLIKEYGKC